MSVKIVFDLPSLEKTVHFSELKEDGSKYYTCKIEGSSIIRILSRHSGEHGGTVYSWERGNLNNSGTGYSSFRKALESVRCSYVLIHEDQCELKDYISSNIPE